MTSSLEVGNFGMKTPGFNALAPYRGFEVKTVIFDSEMHQILLLKQCFQGNCPRNDFYPLTCKNFKPAAFIQTILKNW